MSKVFVLRTHALLSSSNSTQKFGMDNEIVIPLDVVRELQTMKYESFEKGRLARDILDYIRSFDSKELMSAEGVIQENGSTLRVVDNYYDVDISSITKEQLRESAKRTLQICIGIKQQENKKVVLVTNNICLQLVAERNGIKAEAFKDEVFPKLKDQYTGRDVVYTTNVAIDTFYETGFINKEEIFEHEKIEFVENKFFVIRSTTKSALGIFKKDRIIKLRYEDIYPYGISPKNVGQKFMLEALLDDDCPLVIIKGNAGTGKTFCSLAVGLSKKEKRNISRILVTRSVTATEQYGYLPGDIDEKLSPYLAGIKDNLSILIHGKDKSKEDGPYEDGSYFFEKRIIQIQPIGFLRGRSIVDSYFIIDETQNIEPDVIKSIVTRAGQGSKFVFLGDPTQVDNPNLTERYNGLVYLSEKMKGDPMCSQITLLDDESVRSKLAREAAQKL